MAAAAGHNGFTLVFALCCVLTAVSTLLPWYTLDLHDTIRDRLPADLPSDFSLLASGWGGWRLVLPLLALAVAAVALVGVLGAQDRRPSQFATTLRIGALVLLGLVVVTMIANRPDVATSSPVLRQAVHVAGSDLHFDVGWASWLGALFAGIGVVAAYGGTAAS